MQLAREQARWGSPFGSWVRGFGVRRLATQLGTSRQAVYGWVSGVRYPDPVYEGRIVELSNGAVRSEDIKAHILPVRQQLVKTRLPEGG